MNTDLTQLETALKQHNAGNFIEAVTSALNKADGKVFLTLRAFYREPELLYTALSYASARGVAVTFAPEGKDTDVAFHRSAA